MTGRPVPPLSRRLAETAEIPATILAASRARALRAAGHDVISLALGEPDFPTPPHIIAAMHEAALAGETKYPPINGTPALREAIRRKFSRENAIEAAPDEIIVSTGSKQAIAEAFAATLEPGCEVVIPAPYWTSYPLMARMAGGTPVSVACDAADGFRLDPDALARALTSRTRWVMLNFPNNPTGAVCEEARLRAIAAVLRRWPETWVLADDIYEHLIHDGSPHATLAAVAPDLRARVLTVNGVSKSYAMTGFRIGYATGPARLIAAMAAIQGNVTSGASSVGQAAAAAALDGPQDARDAMRAAFARRRDLMIAALAAAPGVATPRPDGAFYLFPSVAGLIGRTSAGGRRLDTDAAIADALLEESHVATVAGAAFGASPHLRLSIASGEDALGEAASRIVRFCRTAA